MTDSVKKAPPSAAADKFIVRLPDGMKARIAEAALANNRTMNAEVVDRLQASFEQLRTGAEDLALRVEERMNEARVEATRSQMYMVRMHIEVLAQRLLAVANAGGGESEVGDLHAKLGEARAELSGLQERLESLLKENREIMQREQQITRPLLRQVDSIVDASLEAELRDAQRRERARLDAIRALNPTQAEVDAAASRQGSVERVRLEKLLAAARPSEIPVVVRGESMVLKLRKDGSGYDAEPAPSRVEGSDTPKKSARRRR